MQKELKNYVENFNQIEHEKIQTYHEEKSND